MTTTIYIFATRSTRQQIRSPSCRTSSLMRITHPGTGYGANGLGSEMLIQSGAGYQGKEWGIQRGRHQLGWAGGGTGSDPGLNSRCASRALPPMPRTACPVFTSGTIALVLESDASPNEWAPTSPIVYTFESAPVALTTNLPLVRLTTLLLAGKRCRHRISGPAGWTRAMMTRKPDGARGLGLFGYTPTPGVLSAHQHAHSAAVPPPIIFARISTGTFSSTTSRSW